MRRADGVARALGTSAKEICGVAAIGTDAVDIAQFERDVTYAGEEFLAQCFSPAEIDHCARDVEKLATRFALKEAALKALGTGIRGIGLRDVEIDTMPSGEPRIRLSPSAQAVAHSHHIVSLYGSATREAGLALAVVVAEPNRGSIYDQTQV